MNAGLLCIILTILSVVAGLEVPEVDFLLDHPAVSLSVSRMHFCTIQQRHNDEEIGGEAVCFGDENQTGRTQPPTDSTFVQIVTGEKYGCGLLLDQTVQCWGKFKDQKVEGLFSQIVGADTYVCGIMTDETIKCFGHLPGFSPTSTKAGFVQIACARQHCCALDKLGVPTCWSEENNISDGHHAVPPKHTKDITDIEVEVEEDGYDDENDLSGDHVQFKQISVSGAYSCGITLKGDLYCWGVARTYGLKETLRQEGPFKTVSVGEAGVCAIHADADEDAADEDTEGKVKTEGQDEEDGKEIQMREVRATPNSLKCWGGTAVRLLGNHIRDVGEFDWDQVRVRTGSICGVTMRSEVKCMGSMDSIEIPEDLIVA